MGVFSSVKRSICSRSRSGCSMIRSGMRCECTTRRFSSVMMNGMLLPLDMMSRSSGSWKVLPPSTSRLMRSMA